ncbi:MAG: SGNH/GDSL hydrolase family protein [Candidatus Hydrogenedentota bacterium]
MGVRQKLRSIFGNVVVLVISTAVALVIAEFIASYWLVNHATQDQFRHYGTLKQNMERFEERGESASKYFSHRYIGYIPSPNYKRGENYHNADGYRGDPIPAVKDPNEFRIVCVGGSTTYTSFVDVPSNSYPAVLERELHERGFTHVRVINAGAEGWASWETLVNVNFRVLDLDPDMVIIYHAVNDVISRIVWPAKAFRGDRSGTLQHTSGLDRPEPVFERSTLTRMLMVSLGRWSSPLELRNTFAKMLPTDKFWLYYNQNRKGRYPQGVFKTTPIERILEVNTTDYFERNIESVIVTCKQQGIVPVLATFKVNRNFDGPVLAQPALVDAIEEHNQVTRTIGAELNVPVFEFAEAFSSDMNLFSDPVHLTEEGAQLKGSLFADFLESQNLLGVR